MRTFPVCRLLLLAATGACGTNTIANPDVGSISLQPVADTVAVGDSIQLAAVVLSPQGALIDVELSWSSSQSGVATVDASGRVRGVAAGEVTITASADGRSATAEVSVFGPPASLAYEGLSPRALYPGGSELVAAGAADAAGHELVGIAVTYTSSDPGVVTVVGDVLQAQAAGDVTITASAPPATATLAVRVRGVHATTLVAQRPYGIAVSSAGRFFVTRLDAAQASGGMLPGTEITDSVPTGDIPTSVAFAPSGATAYTANQDGTVTIVNPATGQATGSINLPGSPFVVAVTPDGGTVWVLSTIGKTYVVNSGTGALVDSVATGVAPNGIAFAPDGSRAFVTDFMGGLVTAVTVASRQIAWSVTLTDTPQGVAVSPDGAEVWIARQGSSLIVLSAGNGSTLATVSGVTDGFDIALADDGETVLVSRLFQGSVLAVRRQTREPIGAVQVGGDPRRIAVHAASGTILVANQSGSVVAIR